MTRKMKYSGVEFIGNIPEEWRVVKLNKVANLITGNTPSKSDNSKYYSEEGLMWVKPDNLNGFRYIKITSEYLNNEGEKVAKGVPPFTPLVCCIGSIGKIGISAHNTAFNQQINAVIFNNKIYSWKFGMFYLMSQESQHWYYSNGNVVKILNSENQGKINVVLPDLNAQEKIANYLDKKCTKIDDTIEKEKQVIEKLKEYKQSVITEVVTKGLNPNVKMKDSGVEWIGEIPEHWKIEKIKYALDKSGIRIGPFGSALKSNEIMEKSDIKVYGQANLIRNDFSYGSKYINFEKFKELSAYEILKGDVLISMMGTIGKCSIFPENAERGIMDSHLTKMTLDTKKVNLQYFKRYFSETFIIDNYLKEISKGSIMNGLNSSILKNILLILPPMQEQLVILEYLDKKCSSIDKLISDKEELIKKLTEYKKSLIYECVTGKREV